MTNKKQQISKEAPLDKETSTDVQKQPAKKKSLIKPLLFFALFALCVEAAVLYPFLTQTDTQPMPVMPPKQPTFVSTQKPLEQPCPECICPETTNCPEPIIQECNCPKSEQADAALIQSLRDRIHQLEIENLSLKETTTTCQDTTPLLLELLRNLYTGNPFDIQIKEILKQDRKNVFVLLIQKKLGAYAAKGIPTNEAVRNLFNSNFQMALDSFYNSKENNSYTDSASDFFKSLVHVYPENLNKSNADGINWLYLARQQVEKNDFSAAVQSISHLPAQSKNYLREFEKAAQMHIETTQMINFYFNERTDK